MSATATETLIQRSIFTAERRPDGVVVLRMDVPGRDVNVLTPAFGNELPEMLDELEHREDVVGLVLISSKDKGFMAGADVKTLAEHESREALQSLSLEAQQLMMRIDRFSRPVVAAIHGACLGAGLELALACDARVVADDGDTLLGAPEVQLGLLPGAGGTVRLPALIGARQALEVMLTGRRVVGRSAVAQGLADEAVKRWLLEDAAARHAHRFANEGGEKSLLERLTHLLSRQELEALVLEENPVGRNVLFSQAGRRARKKSRGNYPASDAILDVVRTGLEDGAEAGYAAESEAFGRLATTSESRELVRVFLGQKRLEHEADLGAVEARPVRTVGIVGAGLMGAGIAGVTAVNAERSVRLQDVDNEAVTHGLRKVHEMIDDRVVRRRLTPRRAEAMKHRVTGTVTWSGFRGAAIVIEAVPEDIELKNKIFRKIVANAGEDVIIASNTSSIPIRRLAEAARAPERVVGMHYFSPVEKMPLVEIVRTEETAPEVVAAALALARAQGKTPVVVNDGPGFYTTRILAPYLMEAAYLVGEGVEPEAIDDALERFGFPVGPLKLADEVGIDVAGEISQILEEALGTRMAPSPLIAHMLELDRKGRKSSKGFYRYDDGERRADPKLFAKLQIEPSRGAIGGPEKEEIAWRCTVHMLDEAVRTLADGIISSPANGDLAAVLGLGFPPFRGGPFRFIDQEGVRSITDRMHALRERHGARFEPSPKLAKMAEESKRFYADD